MKKLKDLFDFKKIKNAVVEGDIKNAQDAFAKTTYSHELTREQLKEKLIKDIMSEIKRNVRQYHQYLCIQTYDGYREKIVLPGVAEYFKEKGFKVDLLNGEDYKTVNVLIINWQGMETF